MAFRALRLSATGQLDLLASALWRTPPLRHSAEGANQRCTDEAAGESEQELTRQPEEDAPDKHASIGRPWQINASP